MVESEPDNIWIGSVESESESEPDTFDYDARVDELATTVINDIPDDVREKLARGAPLPNMIDEKIDSVIVFDEIATKPEKAHRALINSENSPRNWDGAKEQTHHNNAICALAQDVITQDVKHEVAERLRPDTPTV